MHWVKNDCGCRVAYDDYGIELDYIPCDHHEYLLDLYPAPQMHGSTVCSGEGCVACGIGEG